MKNWRHFATVVLCTGMLLLSVQVRAATLSIQHPWVQEGPPVSKVLGAFMTLVNDSDQAIVITGVSNPDFGAVEMHLSKEVNGMARMFPQKQLTVPAKAQLALKHGSYHLMLFDPRKPIKAGDTSQFTFSYSDGSQQTFVIPVKKNTGGMNHTQK